MNNTNNALETLVQRDKQIKKANDKLKASINELDAELETTTNALSNHASNTNIHTSKEELIQLIVDHLESLDLGITKEVVSELPTENISDNTLYFVPNDKGSRDEYFYINDKWELVGSTEINLTDYYTKLETNALLEGKANSKHNHVVNDITDFPTIPTKLSQLENDMGFGTGGGSGDTSDCVHKTGNETISGIKTFNDAIVQKKDGYISNDNIDNTITPSSNLFTHFFFSDKNNIASAFIQYAQRTNGFNEINLFVRDKDLNNYGVSLNTNNEFIPVLNNTYSLGSSSLKWAHIYGTNAYIDKVTCSNIVRPVENSYIYMTAGPSWNNGASIFLNGKTGDGLGTGKGTFLLFARDGTSEKRLLGYPNGFLSWNGCIESHEVRSITANAFMAQNGGYTCTLRNDGSNTYLLMSEKNGTPGTWSSARPLQINNSTGLCSINGNANSAYYSETPATTDNSTRIATTAWVRTYVNSVAGSNTVGSSISAYWSNSSNVTATGNASATNGYYPAGYSEYITKTPTVGTIYSGAQLYTELNAYASAKGTVQSSSQYSTYITSVTAQATFSNPISSTGKYLCTTANTVRFRGYAPGGNSVGTASVVENTSTKSIFIRIE